MAISKVNEGIRRLLCGKAGFPHEKRVSLMMADAETFVLTSQRLGSFSKGETTVFLCRHFAM